MEKEDLFSTPDESPIINSGDLQETVDTCPKDTFGDSLNTGPPDKKSSLYGGDTCTKNGNNRG